MVQYKKALVNNTWEKESWLSEIIILVAIMQFVLVPLYGHSITFVNVMKFVWGLILLVGIFTMAKSKQQAFIISTLPVLFIIFGWINIVNPAPFVLLMELILTFGSLVLLILLVLKKVFAEGPITAQRVVGSVVVYMLLAQLWAIIYIYLYRNIGDAFAFTSHTINENKLHSTFLYFSYTTITTSGFGDIIPVNPIVRSVVQVESVIGVLYPVILISKLVSGVGHGAKKHTTKE
jgi:Ion channel